MELLFTAMQTSATADSNMWCEYRGTSSVKHHVVITTLFLFYHFYSGSEFIKSFNRQANEVKQRAKQNGHNVMVKNTHQAKTCLKDDRIHGWLARWTLRIWGYELIPKSSCSSCSSGPDPDVFFKALSTKLWKVQGARGETQGSGWRDAVC